MKKLFSAGLSLLLLSACAPLAYQEGKSANDLPAHAKTVYVNKVYMVARWQAWMPLDKDSKTDPAPENQRSQNDQEVTSLVRKTVKTELSSLGYKVVETPNPPSDLTMNFFIDYQPENWPISNRIVHVMSRVYTPNGTPVFSYFSHDEHLFGVFGAAFGDSRDEMVTSVTRQTVDETVKELRKPQGNLHQ